MLGEGCIPLSPAEHEAVDKLATEHPGESLSLTRRDPGESGPLLVHVGADTFMVGDDGQRRKQKRAG